MARFSILSLSLTLLFVWCLLAEKGLCRPSSNEEEYDDDYYQNDDDTDYEGEDKDDDEYSGPPPTITSHPLNLEVHPGETVVLPCDTVNLTRMLEVFSLIWKTDSRILFLDKIQQAPIDTRITYNSHNNSLVITNVNASDSGHYICSYSVLPKSVEVMHTLNVFAPAKIKSIEPAGGIFDKGSQLTLKCNVTGYPRPEITWKKLGRHRVPDTTILSTNDAIVFDSIERFDSGTYECIARNDQGPEVSSTVNIRVHYVPEIDVEEEIVTSGEDYEAVLKCVVHAEPKARVKWFKDDQPIPEMNHTRIYQMENKFFYHIDQTKTTDFGKYVCSATNSKGTTNSKVIELTGRPSTPKFIRANLGDSGKSLHVEWDIISYAPISEYKLLYKPANPDAKWHGISPPVEDAVEGNVYKLKYHLSDLPAGDFLVTLRARNAYGWTSQAKPHPFTIEPDHEATAETSKMAEEHNTQNGGSRPRITSILTIISLSAFFL
ncbi:neurotrimin-like isoform X2 [Periplaneta americana]|uniref:neurotrimin-like isoform X2 n=1 Tax=Periplaneta americana TaxID=6978 RepID=UPI0037E7C54C